MIAKELRDVRLIVVGAPLFVAVLLISFPFYVDLAEMARTAPGRAVGIILTAFGEIGGEMLALLAAGLGVGLVSGEVSRGTIFLLLSRPVSRARLLTKYAISAGVLLVAAVLGKALLLTVAAVRGYPLGQMRVLEAVLSVLVLWLGVLFVLGTALLVSVIFRSITASIVACALTLFFVFALPVIVMKFYPMGYPYELSLRLELYTYWMPAYYYYPNDFYSIGGFALTNFLVCLTAAMMPLLAALWLFNRKAY